MRSVGHVILKLATFVSTRSKIFFFEDRSEIVFKVNYLNLKCFSLNKSSLFQ